MTKRYTLGADASYLALNSLVFLLAFGLCRLLLLIWNFDLSSRIDLSDLAYSFFIGARFDLTVIALFIAPLVFSMLLPQGLFQRKLYQSWLFSIGGLLLLIAVSEIEFYREFHARLNTIALQYLSEDTATVSSMVIHGSPVISLLSLWLAIFSLTIFLSIQINRRTQILVHTAVSTKTHMSSTNSNNSSSNSLMIRQGYIARLGVFALIFITVALLGRGTLRSGPPLRWGDAFHSEHLFSNHLGLNGLFTLNHAIRGWGKSKSADQWLKFTNPEQALNTTKSMLQLEGEQWLNSNIGKVYRSSPPSPTPLDGIDNVVFIMLESFSGHYTGALGNTDHITPYFDKLADQGLLFTRFFSNGTHTHQGMFATFACFPNLPDHEYLMQQPAGDINFSGFPAVMNRLGYEHDVYVYNGDFAWDNQRGFFSKQGLRNFVGRKDYIDPIFSDPTWGVSDQDMFNRAVIELNHLGKKGKFFAMLQTLSNHLPYALPSPLPVEAVSGHGHLNQHLSAMRYSDWALGQFFEQIKDKDWYRHTLFVIMGDHGFGVPEQITDIDLLRFRVPALLLAPGIQSSYGRYNDTAASQLDLVPTATGLLGKTYEQACWGRNLLALKADDPGFAMIKPSGSDQTVALISGDEILVKAPDQPPKIERYSLITATGLNTGIIKNQSQTLNNNASDDERYQQLGHYIQTALSAITERKAGQKP